MMNKNYDYFESAFIAWMLAVILGGLLGYTGCGFMRTTTNAIDHGCLEYDSKTSNRVWIDRNPTDLKEKIK